jgi:AraC-like DNA-binding protein
MSQTVSVNQRAGARQYFSLLCRLIGLHRDRFPELVAGSKQRAFAKAHAYVTYCYFRDLTRSRIAAMVGIGPDYLNRAFQHFAGQSYKNYVALQRLIFAISFLRKYDWDLARVADAAGYGSANSLIMHFRRLTGITPHRFRMNLRQGAAVGDSLDIRVLDCLQPLAETNPANLFHALDLRSYHTLVVLNAADEPRILSSMNEDHGLDPMTTLPPNSMTIFGATEYSHWVNQDSDHHVLAVYQIRESSFIKLQ